MKRGLLQAPGRKDPSVSSARHTKAFYFLMRLARCPYPPSQDFSVCCRSVWLHRLVPQRASLWISCLSPPPTARRCPALNQVSFVQTFITELTGYVLSCRRCGTAQTNAT